MRLVRLVPLLIAIAACDRPARLIPTGPSPSDIGVRFSSASAPSGLVACYAAEGNANDASGNNNGTMLTPATFGAGKFGQAFSFDGTSGGVAVPASASLNVGAGDGLTFVAWIFPTGQTANTIYPGSGSILEYVNGAHFNNYDRNSNTLTALYTNLAEGPSQFHLTQADGVITQFAWNHVAVTYSLISGYITLYVNGTVAGVPYAAGAFHPYTASDLAIGYIPAGSAIGNHPAATFNGRIDELQIYNRALSATEIAGLAAATQSTCNPPAPPPPPPTTPPNKDACKNGGWLNYTRKDGSKFKNQGDCIQYVNTGK